MFEFLLNSPARVRTKLSTFVFKTASNNENTTTSCNNLAAAAAAVAAGTSSPRKLKSRASKSLASPKTSSKSTNLVCDNKDNDDDDEDELIHEHDGFVICRAVVIKEFTPSPYDQQSLSLKVTTFISHVSLSVCVCNLRELLTSPSHHNDRFQMFDLL